MFFVLYMYTCKKLFDWLQLIKLHDIAIERGRQHAIANTDRTP